MSVPMLIENIVFTILFLTACFVLGWISRMEWDKRKSKKLKVVSNSDVSKENVLKVENSLSIKE